MDLFDSQIDPFFEVVDKNLDGGISKEELGKFIGKPEEWPALVLKCVDTDKNGYVNLFELSAFIENKTMPVLIEKMVPQHLKSSFTGIYKTFEQVD